MKKKSIAKAIFLAVAGISPYAQAKAVPIKLAALAEKDAPSGCSCAVRNKKNEIIVYSDLESKSLATININGTSTKLKLISTTDKGGKERKGNTFTNLYGNEKTRLNLKYTTVRVCAEKDESCEVTKYSVNLLLEDNINKKGEDYPNKSELVGLAADCGC